MQIETCSRIFTDNVNAFLQSKKKKLLVDEANRGHTLAEVNRDNVFSDSDLKMCKRYWNHQQLYVDGIKVELRKKVVSFSWGPVNNR